MAARKTGRRKGQKNPIVNRPRYQIQTVDTVRDAIWETCGNLTEVAGIHRVTRQATSQFIKSHPELEIDVREARRQLVDMAQNGLRKGLKKGAGWAVRLVLEATGRYSKQPGAGVPDAPEGGIQVRIVLPHNFRDAIPSHSESPERVNGYSDSETAEPQTVSEPATDSGAVPGDRSATGSADENTI